VTASMSNDSARKDTRCAVLSRKRVGSVTCVCVALHVAAEYLSQHGRALKFNIVLPPDGCPTSSTCT
jgi:hypothetical protein